MTDREPLDPLFQEAVEAIDAGDLATLEYLLERHPRLACERLEEPGAWLRDAIGPALDSFFARPYLLWFVSEDAVREGTLPENIAALTRAIIAAARRAGAPNLKEQLDYALRLVAWSGVASECGVQLELLEVLIGEGAAMEGVPNDALVNGHAAAAAHLIARGAPLSLATALCLARWDDAARLAPLASEAERRFAFVLAALNGKPEALRCMISLGADVNARSEDLYSHGTPLHHAVWSGSLEAVEVLVEAGADPAARDTIWDGTPLGWAEYAIREGRAARPGKAYREIADSLRRRSPAE
jgi:peptide-methionine (S)-S-oxide reductase